MLNQLQNELKIAMKSGNRETTIGLRNIIGKLKSAEIDKGKSLIKEEAIKILRTAAKQLNESIIQYNKGGRKDLADKELFELSLIEKYLPKQLPKEEIIVYVKKAIKSVGANSMNDMGQVMGLIMKELSDSVDGNLVKQIVREQLS